MNHVFSCNYNNLASWTWCWALYVLVCHMGCFVSLDRYKDPEVSRRAAGGRDKWNRLWSMKLPSKIKVFCWRLALNSMPTASVLKSKNLEKTSNCKICGAEEDTWDHSLLYCTMSRCVWALVDEDLTDLLATLHITDPKHWVLFMCCNIPHVEGKQILATSWAIGIQGGRLFMKEYSRALSP
jgi:hypothetical protein